MSAPATERVVGPLTQAEAHALATMNDRLKAYVDLHQKIAVFHHPLYSSGDRHGSDLRLREVLEPFFVKYNVSVVFTGHDHFFERVKPQHGITYFVVIARLGQTVDSGVLMRRKIAN